MSVRGRGAALRGLACAMAMSTSMLAACGGGGDVRPAGHAGAAAARGVTAAIEAAATLRAPWRCAAIASGGRPVPPTTLGDGDRTWQREGATVRATRARLVIAAVAQARGAALSPALRQALAAEHPDVVLALGGMGTDEAELERALAPLAVPGALVVALPGDSEPWPALVAVVERLAAGGAAIVDGGHVRTIDAGVAVLATLPGLAHVEQLAAGPDGCVHDEEDVAALLATLAAEAGERPKVLASPRAPQGDDAMVGGGGDRIAGIHAGDPALTGAIATAGLGLVVHGLVDVPAAPGDAALADGARIAAGSLDPAPRWAEDGRPLAPAVTLAIVDARGVRWRSLASASFDSAPSPRSP